MSESQLVNEINHKHHDYERKFRLSFKQVEQKCKARENDEISQKSDLNYCYFLPLFNVQNSEA